VNINVIIYETLYRFNQVQRGCLEQVSGKVDGPETEISNGRIAKTLLWRVL